MEATAYLNTEWPRALIDGHEDGDFLVLGWEGEVTPRGSSVATCEFVYALLNRDDRPNARTHRSLSIGDVVVLHGQWDRAYAVEPLGFEPIPVPDPATILPPRAAPCEMHVAQEARR